MIEDKVIKKVRTVIKRSANNVVRRILNMHDDLKGREEEITAQIASEITLHLLDEVKFVLDDREINGVAFKVYVYKKNTEEPITGADIAGVLDVNIENTKFTKAFLAQSKIGHIEANELGKETIGFTNKDIQKQVENMINRTNSAYVFTYNKKGIDVISAHSVKSMNSNKVKIERSRTLDLGSLYENLLDCWAGDHKLIPYPVDKMKFEEVANYLNAKNLLWIEGIKSNNLLRNSRFSNLEI